MKTINIGRATSGGAFNGLFGNPVRELKVSPQYRKHFKYIMQTKPKEIAWLKEKLKGGMILFCPGCGIGSPTCHARIIEEMLK